MFLKKLSKPPIVDLQPRDAHVLAVENYKVRFRGDFEIEFDSSLNEKCFQVCCEILCFRKPYAVPRIICIKRTLNGGWE